eukprot:Filipodium_phascolosomae@DN4883_c0_g1_i1.p1
MTLPLFPRVVAPLATPPPAPSTSNDTFDPIFIITQIFFLQGLFYLLLSLMYAIGAEVSAIYGWLEAGEYALFVWDIFDVSSSSPLAGVGLVALLIVSVIMGVLLPAVESQWSRCLDLVTTWHVLHVLFCTLIAQFPTNGLWYLAMIISIALSAYISERLTLYKQMQQLRSASHSYRNTASNASNASISSPVSRV